jgi:cytochrome c-type biogenesis protein CcmH
VDLLMFWFIALSIAVLAALLISAPLFMAGEVVSNASANDAEVYRDQISEIDRDEKSGLIAAGEAVQARAEIARRLIAASEQEAADAPAGNLRRPAALLLVAFLCLVLPAGGSLLYARMGSPNEPDQPLAERMQSPRPDINILIAKMENHLAESPEDGKGWELLAPIYMRQMRADDAAMAYRNTIKYLGESGARWGALGETLAAAAQGQVTKDARTAFEKALSLDAGDPRARFYLALADAQAGQLDKAKAEFESLAKDSPPDAPWQDVLKAQIAQIAADKAGAKAPGNPDAADIAAANGLNSEDRAQMIRTMVETLDERLKTDPNNFEGWMRLVRSYSVLGERDKAAAAVKRGLAAFPAASDNGKAILALAKDLGIEGVAP